MYSKLKNFSNIVTTVYAGKIWCDGSFPAMVKLICVALEIMDFVVKE